MRLLTLSQRRDVRMGVICEEWGFRSLNSSMNKRVLNLLEPVKLIVWKVVIERVTDSCRQASWSIYYHVTTYGSTSRHRLINTVTAWTYWSLAVIRSSWCWLLIGRSSQTIHSLSVNATVCRCRQHQPAFAMCATGEDLMSTPSPPTCRVRSWSW